MTEVWIVLPLYGVGRWLKRSGNAMVPTRICLMRPRAAFRAAWKEAGQCGWRAGVS